jgi:predicted RNA-binding protein with PUA-like domain
VTIVEFSVVTPQIKNNEWQQREDDHDRVEHNYGPPAFFLCRFIFAHLTFIHSITFLMTTQYWLVKQEPEAYAWETFVRDGRTTWDGVRNYAARNHLKAMRVGDPVLFYASGGPKCVVGLAEVARAAFPDPTAEAGEGWVAAELKPVRALPRPVALAQIKADPALKNVALVRQGRLSVMPLAPAEFARIVQLGGG